MEIGFETPIQIYSNFIVVWITKEHFICVNVLLNSTEFMSITHFYLMENSNYFFELIPGQFGFWHTQKNSQRFCGDEPKLVVKFFHFKYLFPIVRKIRGD